jgi:hypothetical protein
MEPMAQKIKHLVALLNLAKSQFDYKIPQRRIDEPSQCPDGVQNLDSEESLHCSSDLFKSKLTGY